MKNWNSIEEQLRSWHPRGPSDKVERALFGARGTAGESIIERVRRTIHLTWQGGAAAGLGTCIVLVFTLMNFAQSAGMSRSGGFIVPAVVSNASYAASFAAVEHNCLSAPIFSWTKPGELSSSIRSLESFNTNRLLP